MISEHGAGTIDGLHEDPPVMFTEDYQTELLMAYFPVFDEYRKKFFIGELIWNYADFMIQLSPRTFDGTKKGLFIREWHKLWVITLMYEISYVTVIKTLAIKFSHFVVNSNIAIIHEQKSGW